MRPSIVACVVSLLVAGCGAARPKTESKSSSQYFAEAARHHAEAERHDRLERQARVTPANVACGDLVLEDQQTSGTEQITMGWRTCTDTAWDAERRHRAEARRHREIAKRAWLSAQEARVSERRYVPGA